MARGGSNAIGSASVILSASADGLVAGLSKSEQKLKQFGSNAGKALSKSMGGGPGGGGLFANLAKMNGGSAIAKLGAVLGGGAAGIAGGTAAGAGLGAMLGSFGGPAGTVIGGIAGAAAGLATGTAKAGIDLLTSLPGTVERLMKSASGSDLGVLTGLDNSFNNLSKAGDGLLTRIIVPLGPAIANAVDSASGFMEQLGPAIEFASDAGSALLFVGVELGKQLGGLILDAGKFAAEWMGLTQNGVTGSRLMFKCLEEVGKISGYVWDTFAAGAGLVAIGIGKTVDGLFTLAAEMDEILLKFAKLLDGTGFDVPDWLKQPVENDKLLGHAIADAGRQMSDWGQKQLDSWGASADRFAKAVSLGGDLHKKFDATRLNLEGTATGGPQKLTAAVELGSKESHSIVANYQRSSSDKNPVVDEVKKLREEVGKQSRINERIEKAIIDFGGNIGVV